LAQLLETYAAFQNILEEYFTVIPNLFSTSSKENLENETIKLITRTITELEDEKVSFVMKYCYLISTVR
jgi:hypothetical protein